MNEVQHIERIERYLAGKMPPQEREEFESELLSNPALSEECNDYRLLTEGFNALHAEHFMQRLKQWELESKQSVRVPMAVAHKSSFTSKLLRISAAAAILLIPIAAFFFYQSSSHGPNTQELFASNYEVATNFVLPVNRTEKEDTPTSTLLQYPLVRAGLTAYNRRDYAKAVKDLSAFLQEQPQYGEIAFFLGVSLLEQDLTLEARKVFEKLMEAPPPYYEDQCKWYLALTYLKINEVDQCKVVLNDIVNDSANSFKPNAKKLLEKLP